MNSCDDAVLSMIIIAENDVAARELAIKQEWKGEIPGHNESTSLFWGPHIQMQIQYVTCTLLGTSVSKESKILCRSERHRY